MTRKLWKDNHNVLEKVCVTVKGVLDVQKCMNVDKRLCGMREKKLREPLM